jgi:hypothetical protein
MRLVADHDAHRICTERLMGHVDLTTQMLEDLVRGKIIGPSTGELQPRLKFVIARRWNSWYPSYFKTLGGCYAFVTRDPEEKIADSAGVIVIDPGSRFSETLRKLFNIEPHDIRSVVVSHYHPDHTIGMYELLTLTHESQYPCTYYLNQTAYESYKVFQGKFNKVVELTQNQVVKLVDYGYKSLGSLEPAYNESIYLQTLKTFHEEIGDRHNSFGFIFHVVSGNHKCRLAILGDTDGNASYHNRYLEYLRECDIVILHLGSFSHKDYGKGDKHLYRTGLLNIINCINCSKGKKIHAVEGRVCECVTKGKIRLEKGMPIHDKTDPCPFYSHGYFKNTKLVVISELGMEMASMDHLLSSLEEFHWNSGLYPFLLFAKVFNEKDKYVNDFDERTTDLIKNMSKSDKMRIHKKVFSTLAFRSMREFIREGALNETQSIRLFNFMAILGAFHCWTTIGESGIAEEDMRPDQYCREVEKVLEELASRASKTLKNTDVRRNFELFTKAPDLFMTDFCKKFGISVKNSIHELLAYVQKESAAEILSQMESLSKLAFESAEVVRLAKKDRDPDFRELLGFVKSIGLFSDKALDTFCHIWGTKRVQEKEFDFAPLVYLLSYKLYEQSRAFDRSEASNIEERKKEDDGLQTSRDLVDILSCYSSPEIKYLLSDLGIEIGLSGGLQVKDRESSWISIENVTQFVDKNGNYRLKEE